MLKWLLRSLLLLWGLLGIFISWAAFIGNSSVLIYVATTNNHTDIYFYDVFSGLRVNFTNTSYPEWRGTWSQNGVFAFTANHSSSETDGLFISETLAAPRQIESLLYSFIFGASLSPDGKSLAYISSEPVNYSEIYLVTLADETVQNISNTPKLSETAPQWFADSQHILFLRDGNLYTLNIETQAVSLFLDNLFPIEEAQLSPDNRWLAFHEIANAHRQLVLVNLETENQETIPLSDSLSSDALTWSPDSQRLAMSLRNGSLAVYQGESGMVIEFHGEGRRISPSFSADGRYIAYLENRQIYLLDLAQNRTFAINETMQIRPPFLWLP